MRVCCGAAIDPCKPAALWRFGREAWCIVVVVWCRALLPRSSLVRCGVWYTLPRWWWRWSNSSRQRERMGSALSPLEPWNDCWLPQRELSRASTRLPQRESQSSAACDSIRLLKSASGVRQVERSRVETMTYRLFQFDAPKSIAYGQPRSPTTVLKHLWYLLSSLALGIIFSPFFLVLQCGRAGGGHAKGKGGRRGWRDP